MIDADLEQLVRSARRIAVLGIKPESRSGAPAHFVPRYLASAGFDVVPVPVYYPEVSTILGQPVHRRLADVPGPVDVVVVFRRSEHVAAHLEDILAARPRLVWMQSGIRDEATAEALRRAGIAVVMDRCLMVEHRRMSAGRSPSP